MPRCAAPAPSPSWHWDQADRPACPLAPLRAPLWSCDARPSASASTRPVTRKLLALPSKVSPFSSSKVSNPIVYPKDAEALAWLLFRSHFLELQRGTTPTKIPSGGLSERLQGHFVAQAFQPPDQGSADSVHVDPVKVVRTEFPVVFLTLQHVIGNLQQRVCYRHDRALSSPPSSNAPIQRREVVVLHHRDGPGRLRQTTSERDIALAHLATQPFPGALKTPRTQTSPGRPVP